MMLPPIDFEEVWISVDANGFHLIEGEGIGAPLHFRLEVDAADRDDWRIETVYIVDSELLSEPVNGKRTREHLVPLEGKFAEEVKDFFFKSDKFGDLIQDKVNLEIIPPYSQMESYHEAGRTM